MTNGLAIFDWEGAVVCKHYGEALAAQNYLLQIVDGNLPVPPAFDLAAMYQYGRYRGNESQRAHSSILYMLGQARGILERIAGHQIDLIFGGMSEVEKLEQSFGERGILEEPCSALKVINREGKLEILPQAQSDTLDISGFTPGQILQGVKALFQNEDNARSMKQAVKREERKYSTTESEPVYPGVIEEIEKLKKDGYKLALVHKCADVKTETQKQVADLFDHHERCGEGTTTHKPNPVILRNCIRVIGDSISVRINDLIENTFYVCSGLVDLHMALTTQSHGNSVGSIHCLYSADDHRFLSKSMLAGAFLGMIKIHPKRLEDEKNPGETRRETLRRLKMKYCYQNLSFADHPQTISTAISDLRSRRARDQSAPIEIGYKHEQDGD